MNIAKTLFITGTICLISGIQSCISDYSHPGIKELSNILIVESTITDGTTHVKLTRSVGLLSDIKTSKTVDNAAIHVETADGSFKQQCQSTGNGNYTIETGSLNMAAEYRLVISADGKEYASSFLKPITTPEIDSITWVKRGPGEPIYMCVSTHGPEDATPYYRWSYKENWEVKAEFFANAAWIFAPSGTKTLIWYDLYSANNIYYCWGNDNSKTILLESSEKMSSNIIIQKKLVEIPATDDRLSILYHIDVQQTALRKEAYNYLLNIQKNIEQTGGIFSSMPSETSGNISCISDPNTPVIGYVEVATTTEKALYIPESVGIYEPVVTSCANMITEDFDSFPSYALLQYPTAAGMSTLYIPSACVNCTFKNKATKNKPAWWPTSHL